MNTSNTEKKINPEISQMAHSLFERIELEAVRVCGDHFDDEDFALQLAGQLGESLKGAGGFSWLTYARDLAQTESERAVLSLEEAAFRMNDESLRAITGLCQSVQAIEREWNELSSSFSSEGSNWLYRRIISAMERVKFIEKEITGHWESRAMDYRKEIEKLKA